MVIKDNKINKNNKLVDNLIILYYHFSAVLVVIVFQYGVQLLKKKCLKIFFVNFCI